MTYRVVVSQPERQHAPRLAAALEAQGMLERYISGAGMPDGMALPDGRDIALPATMTLRRVATRLPPIMARQRLVDASYRLFDRRVARRLSAGPDALIGYEAGCLDSFRRARELGMVRILDAASFEARFQLECLPGSNDARNLARKDAEVGQADFILTCSSLAAESYRRVWPGKAVESLPLGVDLQRFVPQPDVECDIDLLFVGHATYTKGADILADALASLTGKQGGPRTVIVTNRATADRATLGRLDAMAEIVGPVSSPDLAAIMQRARLLVLPSRIESFGQVVAEALACGTPVVVSDHVGAGELVEEGTNGWIVPAGDADALAARLEDALRNPERLAAMRSAARQSVEHRTWEEYGRQAVNIIGGWLNKSP